MFQGLGALAGGGMSGGMSGGPSESTSGVFGHFSGGTSGDIIFNQKPEFDINQAILFGVLALVIIKAVK